MIIGLGPATIELHAGCDGGRGGEWKTSTIREQRAFIGVKRDRVDLTH